jgi:putative addiction module component (TIGR02574 family)
MKLVRFHPEGSPSSRTDLSRWPGGRAALHFPSFHAMSQFLMAVLVFAQFDTARDRPVGLTQIRSEVESLPMGRKLNELFREASELTERERAELAGLLLESLEDQPDEDVEAAWAEEIERRVRQIDSGEVATIPWKQVRAELFARLNDKR